jgi:gas vesicle protein
LARQNSVRQIYYLREVTGHYWKERNMKRFGRKNRLRRNTGNVITAAVVGSVVGAAVGLLMAPTTGEEMRRRIRSGATDAREKLKSAAENVETTARELAVQVGKEVDEVQGTVSRRGRTTPAPQEL